MKTIRTTLMSIIFLCTSFVGNSIAGETLDNIRNSNKIILCAGPYAWPYSSTANYPRGFDIDIIGQIAAKEQLNLDIYWAEQKMRGGLGKALRHSIMKGRCDLYMGIANSDSSKDEIEEKNLVFTIPYLGVGYVPIANPEVEDFSTMEDIKGKYKPGVAMSTAIDGYLFYNGYDRDLFARKPTEIDAVAKEEIPISFVMSTQLAKARLKYKNAPFRVIRSFTPPTELSWNVAGVIRGGDEDLLNLLNAHLTEMMKDGTIATIVEKYNVPYFKPFAEVGSSYTATEPKD
jgi:ABC-type amino acid transport substrate-binding protein